MSVTRQGKALLFHFKDEAQLRAVQMALFLAQVQCKIVPKEAYGAPLKLLASDEAVPSAAVYGGQELDGQMIVFAGLDGDRLESALSLLRSNPACGKIPYKAVLTQTNQDWNGFTLFKELQKEHAAMQAAGKTAQP